jgi:curli production assembly/transport component CsgE
MQLIQKEPDMPHFRLIAALVVATAAPGALAASIDSGDVADLATAAEHAAKAGGAVASAKPLLEQLSGAVTDQTVTVAGQEFYKNFCASWHDQPLNELFILSVRELPSARRGNQILVDYAGRTIFQAPLPANRSSIRPLGEKAAEIAYNHMSNAELARMLFRDQDLGPDEF